MTDLSALKYTAEHEWISLDGPIGEEGTVATVGITDFAADKLGDIVFVELPAAGSGVSAGQVVGEIESTKSVGELYAPLTGEVVAANDAVVDDPSLVNADPYGAGWLVKIRIDASSAAELLDREGYVALTGGAE
ncbi:MAG TPA: glycine cleavage system protein GcvH [Microbacterium sp.]|uniref:glycine cleavage system protein GcvH n=1 Tax=Microbacterium sp. TaxID=51671 RepID=UPI002C65BAFB|nr:glycine cleavage system protein GcvH [Microbacterium sp.]HWI30995.1 glycine cleavage system protein GcvH [Microbacterium sp.]